MLKYRYIFVVLVHRNGDDLTDFFSSVKEHCNDYRVVVVNSFFDERSLKEIREIADINKSDFINVENKGYSYGNNMGIQYAVRNYQFEYLIVCNPDILIKKWCDDCFSQENLVYGPIIKTSSGKDQNPCIVKYLPLAEWISYQSYKHHIPKLDYINFGVNRLLREIYLHFMRETGCDKGEIYAVHGSFIVFTKLYLSKISKPFCEKMFLFNEERYLAWNLAQEGFKATFTNQIEIYYKEDGSMRKANINTSKREKESFVTYYEIIHEIKRRK